MIVKTPPVSVIVDAYSTGNFLPDAFTRLGSRLIHVQSTPELMPSMLAPDFTRYTENIVCHDTDATLKELERRAPTCVVAGQEPGVPLADLLSERLGLATNGSRYSSARRDKFSMIERLRACGLRCAHQIKSSAPAEMAAWAQARDSYPFVVKPLASASTDGVFICHSGEEVRRAAEAVLASHDIFGLRNTEALIQTFLPGTEYIVDTVSAAGHRYVCGVWRYEKTMISPDKKIYNKDILVPADSDPVPELIHYVDQVLNALDIRNGASHAEVMMTPDGPALVEIGARLNGNMNPRFHDVCLGANQADLLALAYLSPQEFATRYGGRVYRKRQPAMVYNVPTTRSGTVRGIDAAVVQEIETLPTVHLLSVKLKPGSLMRRTIDLLSSPLRVFLTGPSEQDILRDYHRIQTLQDSVYLLD
jgi:hypothetical protein